MGSKRRRATSPSSSVSGGDFDDGHHSTNVPGPSRKRRRLSNLPTVDPVSTLFCTSSFSWGCCIPIREMLDCKVGCAPHSVRLEGREQPEHFNLAAHLMVVFSWIQCALKLAALAKLCLGSSQLWLVLSCPFSFFPFPFSFCCFSFFLAVDFSR